MTTNFFSFDACFIVSTQTPTLAKHIDSQTAGPHRKISLSPENELILLQPHQLNAALDPNSSLNFRKAIHAIPEVIKIKQAVTQMDQQVQSALTSDKETYKQMKTVISDVKSATTRQTLQTASASFRSAAETKQQLISGNTQTLLTKADQVLTTIDKNIAQGVQEWQEWYQQSGAKLVVAIESAADIKLNEGEKAIVAHTTEKYKLIQEAKELGIPVDTADTESKIKAKRAVYSAMSRDQAMNPTDPRIEQALKKLEPFFEQEKQDLAALKAQQSARFEQQVDVPLRTLQTECKQATTQFAQSITTGNDAMRQFTQAAQKEKAQFITTPAARETPELGNE